MFNICLKCLKGLTYKTLYIIFLIAHFSEAFNTIKFSIFEELPIGTVIGSLQEHLSSQLLSYQNNLNFIKMKTDTSDFVNISKTLGKVIINKRIDKETLCPRRTKCELKFAVNCNNGQNFVGILEVTIDVIDINDNKCSFVSSDFQTIIWPENSSPIDTKEILNRPEDLDSSFTIKQSEIKLLNNSNLFRLEVYQSIMPIRPFILELVLTGELDYESKRLYQLVIEASDGEISHKCYLKLDIEVRDINDNNPIFPNNSYQTEISENYTLFKPFFKITAYDKDSGINAQIYYEIDGYADSEIKTQFGINYTGEIFLKKHLKYHENKMYKIPVIARNVNMYSKFGTCEVIVTVFDINNEIPVITIFSAITGTSTVTITEEQLPGKDIGMITVIDNDAGNNARVNCMILGQSLKDSMELRPTTSNNQYRLVTMTTLDREKVSSISMTIYCHDFGIPQLTSEKLLVIPIIDINDNTPEFSKSFKHIKVNEDSDIERGKNNFDIFKFQAFDRDDGLNGEVRYTLKFILLPPVDLISIDSKSGMLVSNGKLDRESLDFLSFIIVATDQGRPMLSSSIHVNCTILDVNDNSPEFSIIHGHKFTISENQKESTLVGRFFANDPDIGSNAELTFIVETGEIHFPFKIISKKLQHNEMKTLESGLYEWSIEIFTTNSIDRESLPISINNEPGYEFLIKAQDFGLPRLVKRVKIKIMVLDENDNKPQFTFPSTNNSRLTLSYRQKQNYRFGKINAIDNDYGANGSVEYKILDENMEKIFDINALSGDMTLVRSLKISDVGIHKVIIAAYDKGEPSQSSTQCLEIEIDNSSPLDNNGGLESLLFSEQAVNLYIIIAIIVASFVISVVMLTAICIILKKSKRQRQRRLQSPDGLKGRMDLSNQSITNSHSTSLLGLSQIHNSPELLPPAYFRTLSNGQITPTSIRQFIQPYPSLLEEQQCSNNSTDMDSGKGDSVETQNRMMCSFDHPTFYSVSDTQTLTKLSTFLPIFEPQLQTNCEFHQAPMMNMVLKSSSSRHSDNLKQNIYNKDGLTYIKPRFFHLSNHGKKSGEYILTNNDRYEASVI